MLTERVYLREDKTSYFEPYLLNPNLNAKVRVKRPALIICPGGSYLYKSYREGEPVAAQFNAMGYQCFVLSYPTLWKDRYYSAEEVELNPVTPYPEQVLDLFKTIKIVRDKAESWGIDKDKVFVLGFSAGGHVAASAGVYWNNKDYLKRIGVGNSKDVRPDGVVLCYPMVDAELIRVRSNQPIPEEWALQAQYMLLSAFGTNEPTDEMWEEMFLRNKVTPQTPPFFIWHTFEDMVTPAEDTTKFVEKLIHETVKCEYHLFATGHHGMSLSTPAVATEIGDYNYKNAIWPVLADLFLKNLN